MTFKSHVLLCYVGDDDCPVCRFLDGSTDEATLTSVINILDEALAEERQHTRVLMQVIYDMRKEQQEVTE